MTTWMQNYHYFHPIEFKYLSLSLEKCNAYEFFFMRAMFLKMNTMNEKDKNLGITYIILLDVHFIITVHCNFPMVLEFSENI